MVRPERFWAAQPRDEQAHWKKLGFSASWKPGQGSLVRSRRQPPSFDSAGQQPESLRDNGARDTLLEEESFSFRTDEDLHSGRDLEAGRFVPGRKADSHPSNWATRLWKLFVHRDALFSVAWTEELGMKAQTHA